MPVMARLLWKRKRVMSDMNRLIADLARPLKRKQA